MGAGFGVDPLMDGKASSWSEISSALDDIEVAKDELVLTNDSRSDCDEVLSILASELALDSRRKEYAGGLRSVGSGVTAS